MRAFHVVALLAGLSLMFLGGCAVRQGGTRTVSFGPDGITATSETVELSDQELADIEREKTRQVCFEAKKVEDSEVRQMAKDMNAPWILPMIQQTEALNNALSLMRTGKNFDPCPSSTNSQDVEIADAEMYTKIWNRGFQFGETLVAWGSGYLIADSIVGGFAGMAKSQGYSFFNGGDGDFSISDSFKQANFGAGAQVGGGLFSPSMQEIAYPPATALE